MPDVGCILISYHIIQGPLGLPHSLVVDHGHCVRHTVNNRRSLDPHHVPVVPVVPVVLVVPVVPAGSIFPENLRSPEQGDSAVFCPAIAIATATATAIAIACSPIFLELPSVNSNLSKSKFLSASESHLPPNSHHPLNFCIDLSIFASAWENHI